MNSRKDFLKMAGLAGAASIMPFKVTVAENMAAKNADACVLIPSETEGPFPLDLTENTTYFRQDVRESKTGVQLNLKMKIIGTGNCEPMQNVRVNIWHCDKDGLYSGYSQSNNQGQAGLTYLRGYQMTDVNGEVDFVTIFPGWYTGRICHIHFQVFVSSMYRAISQMSFDIATKNAIYADNSSLYTKGADPMTFAQDNIFSDGYTYQIASLTPNTTTGGYDAYIEVAIAGSGVATGLGALEPETGGQFKLKQNFPNPFEGETTIPFRLTNSSEVKIELFDLAGRKVAETPTKTYGAGDNTISLGNGSSGIVLSQSNYIYQISVTNSNGTYRQCKMMTAAK
jgi:protocatechuate 3,4-dioxygenase beta subunit